MIRQINMQIGMEAKIPKNMFDRNSAVLSHRNSDQGLGDSSLTYSDAEDSEEELNELEV